MKLSETVMRARAGAERPDRNINELKERMKRFGLAIIRLADKDAQG